MSLITSQAILLSENQYGNYVMQCVLKKGLPEARADIMNKFTEMYGVLSVQKYSSNVVEKCLIVAENDVRDKIVQELMNNPLLCEISRNEFGNFVIQCAYRESKGAVRDALVEAIRPHLVVLQFDRYGRNVLMTMGLVKSYKKG